MAYKNVATTFTFMAYDTLNQIGKTGDAGNITLRGSADGTQFTPAAPSITEEDATNGKGMYKATFGNTENTGDEMSAYGVSSTANVIIVPRFWSNMDAAISSRLASASISLSGGAVTVGTNNDKTGYTVSTNNDKTGYSLSAGQLFIKKNVGLNKFEFVMTDATTHVPLAGLTVTATRNIDNAGFASCANAVAGVANGWYTIDLAASDLNGTVIAFRFTAVGADDKNFTVITQA
jgi:hypothetical protein